MMRMVFVGLLLAAGLVRAAEDKIILCAPPPPAAMEEVWTAKGWRIKTGLTAAPSEKVVGVFMSNLNVGDANAERVAGYAREGATLFLAIGKTGYVVPAALQEFFPVNAWSFKNRLERDGCQLEGMGVKKEVSVSRRFDMHVPGSAIESPMARYFPERYYKDPEVVTRFAVLDRCKGDNCLPMLVDADVRGTRVILFAGDWADTQLTGSAGFAEWGRKVASLPFAEERPAGTVPRPATDWPIREAKRPYAIALEEDGATLGELTKEMLPPDGIDGITSYRYIYRPGTAPKLKVRLRNHFANIAPLAKARDLKWPENFSAGGLNDMVFTHVGCKGRLPIHGVWCARSGVSEQAAELVWPSPVRIVGFRLTGSGPYRNRSRNNPANFTLSGDGKKLLQGVAAEFVVGSSEERSVWERKLPEDAFAKVVNFDVTGLNPNANGEPRFENDLGVTTFNCGLTEMEVWGWCGEPGQRVNGKLTVTRTELETRKSTVETTRNVTIDAYREALEEVTLTPLKKFGPVRWDFVFETSEAKGRRVLARQSFDVLFVPAEGNKIRPKESATTAEYGLLCSPGWRQQRPFGIGMNNWSSGWGGANDKTWALGLDLMEIGVKTIDDPTRMLATSTKATHYTYPWRRFPNGDWSWSLVEDSIAEAMSPGGKHYKAGKTSVHVIGSDRWHGVQAGAGFTWDEFVRFDQWLREKGEPGLKGKSRRQLVEEITTKYADLWQVFNLTAYADLMLAAKARFAAMGIPFAYETHGSFPLCGGELGAKLAETHTGVGTDVFWELDRQDLWGTLGKRYAVVAINPDLVSGVYEQWGWVNSEQNDFWFSSNGDEEVARRHWYATYFIGRVGLQGGFRPYHEVGYSSQGNHGVRYRAKDHLARCRVHNLVTELRPEEPTGIGLVVSWPMQEKKMGPVAGTLGFGLYPAKGEEDQVEAFRRVYASLVKEGVPISFVTSTHALSQWKGTQPLILVDGAQWEPWEKSAVAALRRRGTPTVDLSSSQLVDSVAARKVAETINRQIGNPLVASPGLTVTPFVSNGHLFLSVCRQGDGSAPGEITLNPGALHKPSSGSTRVISLDDGRALKVFSEKNGAVRFLFPMEPYSARLLMIALPEDRCRASVSVLPGTDFDGSTLTLTFDAENDLSSVAATLSVGETSLAGTVDAAAGTVSFQLTGEQAGRGTVLAGVVTLVGATGTEAYPITFEQGRVAIVRSVEDWICETPVSLGATGTWTELPEVVEGSLHLSASSDFTPTEPAAEKTVVTLAMSVQLGTSTAEPFAEGTQAGVRVVREAGVPRYVFATAEGPVTNQTVVAETKQPVDFKVTLDYRTSSLVYELGQQAFGPYPLDPSAPTMSEIRFCGEGDFANLRGSYENRELETTVARVGEMEYASLKDAVAAANGQPVDLLWDATWSPEVAGEQAVRLNGNQIVFGGDFLATIREGAEGFVTVTIESGLENLQFGRLDLVGDRVTIGVLGAKPGFLYGIARCSTCHGSFETEASSWVRGEALVSGEGQLAVAKSENTRAEFFKVVAKAAR